MGNNVWNLEKFQKEAKKYKTRSEFSFGSRGAYNFARKNNFLDKVYAHMPKFSKQNRIEDKLQDEIEKIIKRKYPKLEVKREYKIPKRDNDNGRVDFFIKNPSNKKFLLIEVKHSKSQWSNNHIRKQLSKYRRSFRERVGFIDVFLLSDTGKYGTPLSNIKNIINNIL